MSQPLQQWSPIWILVLGNDLPQWAYTRHNPGTMVSLEVPARRSQTPCGHAREYFHSSSSWMDVGERGGQAEVLNDTPGRSRWSDISGLCTRRCVIAVKTRVLLGPQSAAPISVDVLQMAMPVRVWHRTVPI